MEADPDIPFVKLLTEHRTSICSVVISLLPGAPGVDDVIQETNALVWTKRQQFEPGTSLAAGPWSNGVSCKREVRIFQQRVHHREQLPHHRGKGHLLRFAFRNKPPVEG